MLITLCSLKEARPPLTHVHLYETCRTGKATETESRSVAGWLEEELGGGSTSGEQGFFCSDESVLQVGSGNDYTTCCEYSERWIVCFKIMDCMTHGYISIFNRQWSNVIKIIVPGKEQIKYEG